MIVVLSVCWLCLCVITKTNNGANERVKEECSDNWSCIADRKGEEGNKRVWSPFGALWPLEARSSSHARPKAQGTNRPLFSSSSSFLVPFDD